MNLIKMLIGRNFVSEFTTSPKYNNILRQVDGYNSSHRIFLMYDNCHTRKRHKNVKKKLNNSNTKIKFYFMSLLNYLIFFFLIDKVNHLLNWINI